MCGHWLSNASASEDYKSSQICKIISCISLYNVAKILFFYEIKRVGNEKISQMGQNAWFWSRKRRRKGRSRRLRLGSIPFGRFKSSFSTPLRKRQSRATSIAISRSMHAWQHCFGRWPSVQCPWLFKRSFSAPLQKQASSSVEMHRDNPLLHVLRALHFHRP